jgi:hypothetical protein
MRIVVNHLTRMEAGYICVAGVDLETRRHIRPVILNRRLAVDLLKSRGGVFELGAVIDLGPTRYVGRAPEMEDHEFTPSLARHCGRLTGRQFWDLVTNHTGTSLLDMFGDLEPDGRAGYSIEEGGGKASLGCLVPAARPELYINRFGKTRLRIADPDLIAELSVTDIRLVEDDHQTPRREAVEGIQRLIESGWEVIVAVGLTRPYRKSDQSDPRHWLQANNIFVRIDPLFAATPGRPE